MLEHYIERIAITSFSTEVPIDVQAVFKPGVGTHYEIHISSIVDKMMIFVFSKETQNWRYMDLFVPELMGYLETQGYSPVHTIYQIEGFDGFECIRRSASDALPDLGRTLLEVLPDKSDMQAAKIIFFGQKYGVKEGVMVALRIYPEDYDRQFHDAIERFAYHLAEAAGIEVTNSFYNRA